MPQRIQMTRHKPWRKDHPDAVIVARPSRWGNPVAVGSEGVPDRATAVKVFRETLEHKGLGEQEDIRRELRGKDLACWCPLDQPCHADVLLEIANDLREKSNG